MPIFPSRLNAAGTVPKGISSKNLSVLNKDELNPLFPFFSKGERFFFSLSFIFFGSTSHSQLGISLGLSPKISKGIPEIFAAISAFQTLGLASKKRFEALSSFKTPIIKK